MLSKEEVEKFQNDGYLGPFTLMSPEAMTECCERVDREVLSTKANFAASSGQSRHLDCPVVWELCSHPEIVERMADIYGPNLILWRSNFFIKNPGDKEIPWHSDQNYWPLEPKLNISAWIALEDSTIENSCVQVIPGSQKKSIPHIPADPDMAFDEMADPDFFDESKAVSLEMKAGQFIIFNEKTLHHSYANTSDKRRLALAVRVTVPFVKVNSDELFPEHVNIALKGDDYMGFNKFDTPLPYLKNS
ncbi:MAG: phytanoyl-CoA dioxygenase family protein [Lentisphaeria bacterium]|nr:phytanoyl-CoA dioxygenase family protein [Lentisphaeria bacterium]NQZ69975.1 phytanoyl-CoA dioxygenase family protein [Lentisphaeria bacterium]